MAEFCGRLESAFFLHIEVVLIYKVHVKLLQRYIRNMLSGLDVFLQPTVFQGVLIVGTVRTVYPDTQGKLLVVNPVEAEQCHLHGGNALKGILQVLGRERLAFLHQFVKSVAE